MFVDEKKAQNVSEVGENKVYMGSVACKNEFDKYLTKYGYQ
jgi:hypothetical protein